MAITVASILDGTAALLNDTAKQIYTYVAMVPHFNTAQDELAEMMEQNNVPVTNTLTTAFLITSVMTDIGGVTGPALPTDLIEIQGLFERTTGSAQDYVDMDRREFLPTSVVATTYLEIWAWINQIVQFLPHTGSQDVLMQYIAMKLPPVADENATITLINARSFLKYRTAALCAQFIGENKTRADDLNVDAGLALDRFLGINTKGRQEFSIRRRPFMSGYRNRGGVSNR